MASGTGLKPPAPMDLSDNKNLIKIWHNWREEAKLYVELALSGKSQAIKKKTLLYIIGERGREIYKTLTFAEDEDDRTVEHYFQALETHCVPKVNETLERYHFFTKSQSQGETFEQFLTALRMFAKTCNFADLRDSLIRDRIVCGILNADTREKLLREDDLDLDKCVKVCQTIEYTDNAVKQFAEPRVNKITKWKEPVHSVSHNSTRKCKFCGKEHLMKKSECVAWGKTCTCCHEYNHFAAQCESLQKEKRFVKHNSGNNYVPKHHKKRVNAVMDGSSGYDDYFDYVRAVYSKQTLKN